MHRIIPLLTRHLTKSPKRNSRSKLVHSFPFCALSYGHQDIRLIAFITEPGPMRKILTHLGEPLEPPPVSPARGPPTDWGELVQVHDDRNVFQATDRRAARTRYPQPLPLQNARSQQSRQAAGLGEAPRQRPKNVTSDGKAGVPRAGSGARESLISRPMLAEVPLAGLP